MKINTIFLDMDGVIADFRKGCENLNAIQGTKVDWEIVHKAGSDFWANLDWCEGGQKFYKWLVKFCKEQNIDLCILSAINYDAGMQGKQDWLDKNCPEIPRQNRYFSTFGKEKVKYANKTSLLIDDFGKNIERFIMAGGQGIVYTDPTDAMNKVLEGF